MPDRPHSEAIRQRFVTAVETLAVKPVILLILPL
jgi:hypothetical protein